MLKQLQAQYIEAMSAAEEIRLKYEGKPGEMTGPEQERWETALADADRFKGLIEKAQKQADLEKWGDSLRNELPHVVAAEISDKGDDAKQLELTACAKFLQGGWDRMDSESKKVLAAYQAGNPAGGGYTIVPQVLANMVLTKIKDLVFVRNLATVWTLNDADSLGVPAVDTDPTSVAWSSELSYGTEESGMVFGKRALKPNPLSAYIKLSRPLIRKSNADIVSIVVDRFAYKMGTKEEDGFMNGVGANQPLGVFVASAMGISTGQDTTAANASSIVADDLINVKHDLKAQYWPRAVWIINRTVLKAIRKLKDSNNNYVWASGLGPGGGFQGNAATLLDQPYYVSEYAPGTITTGLYTAILGDFSMYHIADSLSMQMDVANELYLATNQVGYFLRKETDGMPVLEEAFRRLKQA